MPDSKDDDAGFLSRVYRFVNSPRTEWGDFDPGLEGTPDRRSDLQTMIERKRRNDFVRKQEFEMLRRIRREGVTAAQIRAQAGGEDYAKTVVHGRDDGAALGATLRSKIDDLEKTMVLGPRTMATVRESPVHVPAPSQPAAPYTMPVPVDQSRGRGGKAEGGPQDGSPRVDLHVDAPLDEAAARATAEPAPSPSRWLPLVGETPGHAQLADPVLEEAAFAFASADFISCERSLRQVIAPGSVRERDAPTWLTLLDLYRATGQQQRFEATAADYRREFGLEPGPWESLPRLAAGVAKAVVGQAPSVQEKDLLKWTCPAFLDGHAMAGLVESFRTTSRRGHLDWSALQMIDGQAARGLEALLNDWASSPRTWYWNGIDRLFDLLDVAAPPSDDAADPAFWRLRLAALRLLGRREDHQIAANEMKTLYGEAPSDWKPPRQTVRQGDPPKEAGRSEFMVSTQPDPLGRVGTARVDLAGQLTGDIAGALTQCNTELQEAEVIHVDCTRLIRVDFVAAGELINWVSDRRARQRVVHFRQLHRLLALFFCAMGLDDHATIEVRQAPSQQEGEK